MTNEFDADTAVDAVGMGSYRGTVTDRWSVAGRPNGGYLMAIALRAMGHATRHPDPMTMTAHFLRSPSPGPVDVDVDVLRAGRTVSTAQAALGRGGREFVRAIAAFGDLEAAEGPTVVDLKPPGLPVREDCVPIPGDGLMPDGSAATIMARFDVRAAPDAVGWVIGRPSVRSEMSGWVRFRDGREPDLLALVQMLDAFPPAVLAAGHPGSVPTIELTAHLRAHPAPGWLRYVSRTRALIDGYLEEEAELWDSEDRLVAQARQFARLAGAGEG